MGGNAFGTPAVPLIRWAYDRLLAHITQALSGLELAVPPPLPKEEHGDVDVLVSSSLPDFEGDSKGKPAATYTDIAQLESRGDIDGVCSELCRRIGGTMWTRFGRVVSVAVPLSIALPSVPPPDPDEFHQVDLILVPPRSLAWAQMEMTYGQAPQLLKLLCRTAAGGRMSVQATHLGFLCQGPQKRRLEIELTTSPAQLCAWLGLKPYDPHTFHNTSVTSPTTDGAGTGTAAEVARMEPVFAWLGSAPPASLAGRAYARLVEQWEHGGLVRRTGMVPPLSNRQKKMKYDDDVAETFCRWLAEHRRGGTNEDLLTREENVDEDLQVCRARCPELGDEAIRTLLFFDKMETYLATRA